MVTQPRSKSTKKALEALEDKEDAAKADRVMTEIKAGRMETISLDDAWRQLGLERRRRSAV